MPDSNPFLFNENDLPALQNIMAKISSLGYCENIICKRLGLSDLTDLQWRALPVYRKEKLTTRDLLTTAIELLFLQGIIPSDELNRLFDLNEREVLVRSGLLAIDENGSGRAFASLYPVGKQLIFSDHAWPMLPHPGYDKFPAEHVMFIAPDSRWLAQATVRRPASATLDLCTGSGIHALLAAPHSQRVVAVDINPRAIQCTRLNAQISGLTNIETALGDLYQPVAGEKFDLITANPPFVPAPKNRIRFRDGGCSGEDIQSQIIAGLPTYLAPGGIAQIVTEFGESDNNPISDRIRGWLNGAPIDIYILRLRVRSATEYAIEHAEGDTYGDFLNSVEVWADNLRAQNYTRIVSVLLAFQWSEPEAGQPWTCSEEALPPTRYAGDEIEATFFVEYLARNPKFKEILEHSRIRRVPVGLMEARVLGVGLGVNVQAKVFGKSLVNVQFLEPVEREILLRIEQPMTYSELRELIRDRNLSQEEIFAAVASLFKRKLILLDPVTNHK